MNSLTRNPFGPPVPPPRNSSAGDYVAYRDLFPAALTGVTLVSGQYLYTWAEQTFDPTTGTFTAANPARSGGYTAGPPAVYDSPALELNNASISVTSPVYVWMRQKGFVNGGIWYEFTAPVPPSTTCTGCEWLSALSATDCLEVSLNGTDAGFALSSTNGTTWTSSSQLTVCGIAYTVAFTLSNGTWSLTLTTASGSATTFTGTQGCCGCNYVVFGFPTAQLCGSGTYTPNAGGPCANVTRVRLDWAACPAPTIPCCPNPAPRELCLTVTGGGYTGSFTLYYLSGSTWRQSLTGPPAGTPSVGICAGVPLYYSLRGCATFPGSGGTGAWEVALGPAAATGMCTAANVNEVNYASSPGDVCPDAPTFSLTFTAGAYGSVAGTVAVGACPVTMSAPAVRATAAAAAPRVALPCVHEGGVLERCHTCRGEDRHVRECDAHGTCTRGPVSGKVRACATCADYRPDAAAEPDRGAAWPVAGPARVTRIDPSHLQPTPDGRHLNCSLFEFKGRRLLAYRAGWWVASVAVAELGPDLQPVRSVPLALGAIPEARDAAEDPRLFVFRGRLHVQFTGCEGVPGVGRVPQVCLARLRDDLTVEHVWAPQYPRANRRAEKNWVPFEHDGELLAVYWVNPHRVVRLNDDGTADDVAEVPPWRPNWTGGEMRGGAAPVRIGNEYYHWFHGWQQQPNGQVRYSVGVYTFAAAPPFRPLRGSAAPLWLPDPAKVPLNGDPRFPAPYHQSVIYPCGAVLTGDRWLVRAGHQDAECLIGAFDAAAVERQLAPV